jgi:hypothetical protein
MLEAVKLSQTAEAAALPNQFKHLIDAFMKNSERIYAIRHELEAKYIEKQEAIEAQKLQHEAELKAAAQSRDVAVQSAVQARDVAVQSKDAVVNGLVTEGNKLSAKVRGLEKVVRWEDILNNTAEEQKFKADYLDNVKAKAAKARVSYTGNALEELGVRVDKHKNKIDAAWKGLRKTVKAEHRKIVRLEWEQSVLQKYYEDFTLRVMNRGRDDAEESKRRLLAQRMEQYAALKKTTLTFDEAERDEMLKNFRKKHGLDDVADSFSGMEVGEHKADMSVEDGKARNANSGDVEMRT